MKLYFSPLACSLAARIVLRELRLNVDMLEVDTRSLRTETGADYSQINALGMVPALELDSGEVLTENAAVLQYLANQVPDAGLAPTQPLARARLQQWLSFVGTELHKAVYLALLDPSAPDAVREEALRKADSRLRFVANALAEKEFLLEQFSVADAHLFAILNWSKVTPISLAMYPDLAAYAERVQKRPAVAHALREEVERYGQQQARRKSSERARTTRDLMAAFNEVFLSRDPGGLDALVAEDCELVNVDGTLHSGKRACLALWRSIALDPTIHFELEGVRAERDSAVITWTLVRGDTRMHGVNLMRLREGRIVEARGYASGPSAAHVR